MPDLGGPCSISHDDGASTEVTGTLVSSIAWITAGKGSRTSPEKLKPWNKIIRPGSLRNLGIRGEGAGCGPTEDGVDDMIGRLERGREVIDKGDVEVL